MRFTQVEGIVRNVLAIFLMTSLGGLYETFLEGNLHSWHDIPDAADHAIFIGAALTVGWIVLKSPMAKMVGKLLQSTETTTVVTSVKSTQTIVEAEPPSAAKDPAKEA